MRILCTIAGEKRVFEMGKDGIIRFDNGWIFHLATYGSQEDVIELFATDGLKLIDKPQGTCREMCSYCSK